MSNAPVDLNKLTPEEKRKLLVEMLRKKSEQNIHPGNFYENLKNSNQNKAMADLKYAEEDKVVTGLKYPEEYKVVADLKYSEEDKTVAELKYPDKDKTMADLKYLEEVKATAGLKYPKDDKAVAGLKYLKEDKAVAGSKILDKNKTLEVFRYPEEYKILKESFDELEQLGFSNIYFNVSGGLNNNLIKIEEKSLINYTSYNYLGMSGDPLVSKAAKEAIDRHGTSVSASRLVSGEKMLHRQLEEAISKLLGTDSTLVLVGGFGTNETILGHLMGPGDLIMFDSIIHASIQEGCKLSGAEAKPFPHNNWDALDRILQEQRNKYRQVLIVIEGVYSMDGDVPDLPKFIEIKKIHHSFLMVDEAHSIGVLGERGAGIGEYFAVNREDVEIWMGTLSKSFASCGGYISGRKELIEYLKYTLPGFVYSVGMSPANTAAALKSIQLLLEQPYRLTLLHQRAELFLELCQGCGFNTGTSKNSAIIPIILKDSLKTIKLYKRLFDEGIYALPIMYPIVPENSSRLRFFISSTHSEEEIRKTVQILEGLKCDIM